MYQRSPYYKDVWDAVIGDELQCEGQIATISILVKRNDDVEGIYRGHLVVYVPYS